MIDLFLSRSSCSPSAMTKLDIHLANPKNFYSCGDVLHGKCVVRADESVKLQTLYVEFEGESYAHWTTRSNKKTRHHTSRFHYFQLKQALLVSNDSNNNEPIKLQAGDHEYPFTIHITPEPAPSSFNGSHGHIRYWLKAKIVRNWAFDIKAVVDLPFYNPIILNPALVTPSAELSREKHLCCLCCQSLPINMTVTFDKTAYQVGENILISAQFRNPTTRDMTPRAKLMAIVTYTAGGSRKIEHQIMNVLQDEPLTSNNDTLWTNKPLLVPPTVNTINCQNINVQHLVKVTMDIPGSLNLHVDHPILIGVYPQQQFQQPQQYQQQYPPPQQQYPPSKPQYPQSSSDQPPFYPFPSAPVVDQPSPSAPMKS